MKSKAVPYKEIIDVVFKTKLLPAAYRWVSALPPEDLIKFKNTFEKLTRDEIDTQPTLKPEKKAPLPASRYTIPEWRLFQIQPEDTNKEEDLLACPTSSHLTYGAYSTEQALAARAHPSRTRANDRSQINAVAESPEYLKRWSEKNMTTTYMNDTCHSQFHSTINNETPEQKIAVASKGTFTPIAEKRAIKYLESDPVWTRQMREFCRALVASSDATAYRQGFTEVKKIDSHERIGIPKWRDPEPVVSNGVHKTPETFWQTSQQRSYGRPEKITETFKVTDQHHACYSRPFDLYPMAETMQTSNRVDFVDHMGNKDEHPEYFKDMRVRIPPGSAVVGDVLGTDNI